MQFEFDREAVSMRLCEEIKKLGLSQQKLATLLGCDLRLIGVYLRGKSLPNIYYLTALHYAGCDVIYIMTGDRRA